MRGRIIACAGLLAAAGVAYCILFLREARGRSRFTQGVGSRKGRAAPVSAGSTSVP